MRCTGPGRSPVARAHASDASERHVVRCSSTGDAGIVEPADRVAVQVGLLDGLRRADAVQLRRTIGGQHQHRHARLMGLDDRCVKVRGGGAAGAQQRRRYAGRQRDAESGERSRPLVVEDVDFEVGPGGQRQRHRRAPRTRCDDGVTQSVAHPLVDQRGAERGLHVLRRRGHDRHDTGLSSSMCAPTSRSRSGRTSSARGATSASVASRRPSPNSPTRSTSTSSSGRIQLDPTASPGKSGPVLEAYAKKFGGPERAQQIIDHVTSVAADSGIAVPHGPRAARQHVAGPSAAVARAGNGPTGRR